MKCSKCNADIFLKCESSRICAGSTVSGTDAIENVIEDLDLMNAELPSSWTKERYEMLKKAREQLTARTERIARAERKSAAWKELCKRHDAWFRKYFPPEKFHDLTERIAELEKQNAELNGKYTAACITIRELEQQIKLLVLDQMISEKRGYELAREYALEKSDGYTQIKPYDELSEYERDGGSK